MVLAATAVLASLIGVGISFVFRSPSSQIDVMTLRTQELHLMAAVMLVHCVSLGGKWFEDFEAFARLFGVGVRVGELAMIGEPLGIPMSIGWCKGDRRCQTGNA